MSDEARNCRDTRELIGHAVTDKYRVEFGDARKPATMNFKTEKASGTWPNRQKNPLA